MMINKLMKNEEEIVESLDKFQRKVFSLWKEKVLARNFPFHIGHQNQFHQIPISVLNNFANGKGTIVAAWEISGSS